MSPTEVASVVLSRGGYYIAPLPAQTSWLIAPLPSTSTLTEIDVSDPASLSVMKTLTLDGQYVDARLIGSTVRVVSSSSRAAARDCTSPECRSWSASRSSSG